MKKKVLIFGTTMFSKEMKGYLQSDSEHWNIQGFVVDSAYKTVDYYCDYQVYEFEKIADYFDMSEVEILPAIGYHEMNEHRIQFFSRCHKHGYKIATYIDPTVINYAQEIGEGNIILDFVQLRHDCIIGKGNIIKGTSDIAHDAVVGDFNYFAGLNHIGGASHIGDCNFLGISCIIGNQVKIGYKNLIGMGVIVSEDQDQFMIISPAKNRVIRSNEKAMSVLLNKSLNKGE